MFKVLLCVSMRHDWTLVIVAGVVCIVASWASFFLYSKAPRFPAWRRWCWVAMTGLVAGSGIWTTHFVAMLAFETGLPAAYAPLPTLGSLGVAVVGTTLGFAVALAGRFGRRGTLAAARVAAGRGVAARLVPQGLHVAPQFKDLVLQRDPFAGFHLGPGRERHEAQQHRQDHGNGAH